MSEEGDNDERASGERLRSAEEATLRVVGKRLRQLGESIELTESILRLADPDQRIAILAELRERFRDIGRLGNSAADALNFSLRDLNP